MAAVPETVAGYRVPRLAPGEEPPLVQPRPRSFADSWRELRSSKDLLRQMVRRDLATKHAGSMLGFLWSLLTPAMLVAVYATVFWVMGFSPIKDSHGHGEYAHIPFALFFFAGLVLWNVFNAGLAGGTGSVVDAGYLVRKIYFPREILPLSVVLSGVVTFTFEFVVLLIFQSALGHPPHWTVVIAIPVMAIVATFAYGCGLFLAAATVYFRDLKHFIVVLLQLLFWSAPIIYDLSRVSSHPRAVQILLLNPLTPCLIAFRESVLVGKVPGPWRLLYSAGIAVVTMLLGSLYFNRHERRMAELV